MTLNAFDCMPVGMVPPVGHDLPPSLPFYQPAIGGSTIDSVVVNYPPTTNRFSVHDAWDGTPQLMPYAITPIVSWVIGEFTGLHLYPSISVASSQRGQVDSYGQSGVQVSGTSVGLWMNSMDVDSTPMLQSQNGSGALQMGCWYYSRPYAQLFPTEQSHLDVSFDVGVGYDGSVGNAKGQAYFQLLALDQSANNGQCGKPNQPGCPGINIVVGFYGGTSGSAHSVHGDATAAGSLPYPIADINLDYSPWVSRMSDSMPYQTGSCVNGLCSNGHACSRSSDCFAPVFAPQHVHFRISRNQLLAIRQAALNYAQIRGFSLALSANPLDYGISLLNVNGETYDPCKDPSHQFPCNGADHAQLGISVANLRVTSTVPHAAAGTPWGFNGVGPQILYRDTDGNINVFSNAPGKGLFAKTTLHVGGAVGEPMGYLGAGAPRVVYRQSGNRIFESWYANGAWSTWDMTSTAGAALSASDPKAYVHAGWPHVVYRNSTGSIHELYLDGAGWHADHITDRFLYGPPPRAVGSPMGYGAGGARRWVYRDVNNHIREITEFGGNWNHWDMTSIPGANNAYSDPKPYVDDTGMPHVVYRDIVGHVHELFIGSGGWTHVDVTAQAPATAALGSPMGFVAGGARRIVYYGTDSNLHEFVYWAGQWANNDLTSWVRGALPTASDPMGFEGSDGVARIEYKGVDGQLHEIYYSSVSGWLHRDM